LEVQLEFQKSSN